MSLIQLGWAALRCLIELVEVSGALVRGVRQRVSDRGQKLPGVVTQRDQQAVVDGQSGIIDRIDRPEVWIDEAVDGTEVRRGVDFSVGQGHRRCGEGSRREDRLLVGRHKVQVEPKIPIRLAGDAIGISQQSKTVTIGISHTQSGLGAELVFYGDITLLHVGTTECGREDDDGRSAARAGGK